MIDAIPAFVVLAVSFLACVANEVVSWLLVYRTEKYQRLKGNLLKAEKRLETIRSDNEGSAKARKKKETRTELEMKSNMKEVQGIKFYNMILTGIMMFLTYNVLSWAYKGVPVAALPFAPLPFLMNITQRGLPKETHPQLVSVTALYVICQLGMRTLVSKVFNFGLRQSLQNLVADFSQGGVLEKKTS